MEDLLHLLGYSCLGDGCGALCLGGVGVYWESRARKGGGELGGACLWGGVDGVASLHDEHGCGVDRGFGSAPFQVERYVSSCFIRFFQYP